MITFAHSVVDVSRSPPAVEAVLGGDAAVWLADLVDQVGQASSDLLTRLGPPVATARLPTRDEVQVHRPVRFHRQGPLLLALSLRASDAGAVIAAAEVDLEAARQGTGSTRLELRARFTTSAYWDRACDRRVLRWMLRDYARRLVARIEDHLLGSAAA